MPEAKCRKFFNKRQIQAICGIASVVMVLTLLVLAYPLLQLRMAGHLNNSGKYAQAEKILNRLVESKPEWTEPRYQLTLSQLYQGKGREAAVTVFSLAEASRLEDAELAIIFLDVAEYLLNTGHGDAALELGERVLTQRNDDPLLTQAVIETGFRIAELYDLPLALDAIDMALSLAEDNWLLNRKAFNILLTRALESPPHLSEPALDRALDLYPTNIIAITRKAGLLNERVGPREALDYLVQIESELKDITNQEYLNNKRNLIIRLANLDPNSDLTRYARGMPDSMLVDIASMGLVQAMRDGRTGFRYYELAAFSPQIGFQYGRNLYQLERWKDAEEIFQMVQKQDADYANYNAIFAALNFQLKTSTTVMDSTGFTPDMAQISPDSNWLAWRRWINQPWTDEFEVSDLVLTSLSNHREVYLGDAILFKWSPDSDYLAYLTIKRNGAGSLQIYSVAEDFRYAFPEDYDVIDFNWAGDNLMIQAERNNRIRLLHLVAPLWDVVQELEWDAISDVNQDYAWISFNDKTMQVHEEQKVIRKFNFEHELVSFSPWSPNGNLAIIEDASGMSWIYNHRAGNLTPIQTQGVFAAWGSGERIYWYFPVWERLHVMVRLDSAGVIREYLPYAFPAPVYEISVSADCSSVVLVDNNKVLLSKR